MTATFRPTERSRPRPTPPAGRPPNVARRGAVRSRLGTIPPIDALLRSNLSLPGRRQGKVRDVYDLPSWHGGGPALLIVATDRISAFDVVMPTPITGKGRLLTDLSTKWFRFIEAKGITHTHLLSTSVEDVPGLSPSETEMLRGRITIARRCRVVPIECVVRGYLAGSGWKEYQQSGAVCGVKLPAGLQACDRLMDKMGGPIFTPATKEEQGHDENIPFERACEIAGRETMERLRATSIAIYLAAHAHALSRGVILADTKFEFGVPLDSAAGPHTAPILIDEALTPDSSRYWPADQWKPGKIEQPSFDKQFLREYLESLVAAGKWAKSPPGPQLPDEIVAKTLAKYEEARDRLFGP